MSPKPRRQFTQEQKAEAVQIVLQSGKPISQISKELGLTESALRNWVKQAHTDQAAAPDGALTTEERQELNRLRRDVKRLQLERDFLKKSCRLLLRTSFALCSGKLKPYELIEAEKANFPIALMCEILAVSRSGYYTWCHRPPSSRTQENERLSQQIQDIYKKSRKTYGAPTPTATLHERIHAVLREQGFQVGRHRVARLMTQQGICVRSKRRFKTTTDSNHPFPIAQNVLERNFNVTEPDRAWVADITYIPTLQGWLYLAVIIDLFSRRVVGWSMAEHMRVELVLGALQAALGHRVPAVSGLLFHSDRGSQYASGDYRAALQEGGISCSMSRRGNCWDNAVAESFFGTLKTELIHLESFATREIAKTAIVEWIEVFYNRQRIHSTLNYLSPVQFEQQYWLSLQQLKVA